MTRHGINIICLPVIIPIQYKTIIIDMPNCKTVLSDRILQYKIPKYY